MSLEEILETRDLEGMKHKIQDENLKIPDLRVILRYVEIDDPENDYDFFRWAFRSLQSFNSGLNEPEFTRLLVVNKLPDVELTEKQIRKLWSLYEEERDNRAKVQELMYLMNGGGGDEHDESDYVDDESDYNEDDIQSNSGGGDYGFFSETVLPTDDNINEEPPLECTITTDSDGTSTIAQIGSGKNDDPFEALQDDYAIYQVVGSGQSGSVVKAKRKRDHKLVAIKHVIVPENNDVRKEHIIREVQILQRYFHDDCHPGILCMYETRSPSSQHTFIITELIDGTNLKKLAYNMIPMMIYANPQEMKDFWFLCIQMFSVVNWIHQRGIVHRDLTPENFVLLTDRTRVKLIDFGLACSVLPEHEFSPIGCKDVMWKNMHYSSPDILENYLDDIKPSAETLKSSDIWALGVTLYQLCFSKTPYQFANVTVTNPLRVQLKNVQQLATETLHSDANVNILLSKILQIDPADRWDAQKLLNFAKEAWMETAEIDDPSDITGDDFRPMEHLWAPEKVLGLRDTSLIPGGDEFDDGYI